MLTAGDYHFVDSSILAFMKSISSKLIIYHVTTSSPPQTHEISLHQNNSHHLHRVTTHTLVLVILFPHLDKFNVSHIYVLYGGQLYYTLHTCIKSVQYVVIPVRSKAPSRCRRPIYITCL